jgi:hypothetical protein
MPSFNEDVNIRRHDLVLLTVGAPSVPVEGPDLPDDFPVPEVEIPFRIPGRYGTVRLMGNADKETVLLRGSDATVEIGASRSAGHLVVRNFSARDVFNVDSQSGTISAEGQMTVRDTTGHDVIELDGGSGTVSAGVDGADGHVIVRDGEGRSVLNLNGAAGQLSIGVDGAEGHLVIRDENGVNVFNLNGMNSTLTVGSASSHGNIVVRDETGRTAFNLAGEEAIFEIGDEGTGGDIIVNDLDGRQVIHVDGNDATLFLGASGMDPGRAGRIVIRDEDGGTRIDLDGSEADIKLMGADLAEDFDTATPVAPGTVVVAVGPDEVAAAATALDRRVVGVTSGAGDFQPALRLASKPGKQRVPVAIVGRVYCQADADYGAIVSGDLLTTSATQGHAMRTEDAVGGAGAILGKALAPLEAGTGLIPVLLTLR